jgi:hypothetical protein
MCEQQFSYFIDKWRRGVKKLGLVWFLLYEKGHDKTSLCLSSVGKNNT